MHFQLLNILDISLNLMQMDLMKIAFPKNIEGGYIFSMSISYSELIKPKKVAAHKQLNTEIHKR